MKDPKETALENLKLVLTSPRKRAPTTLSSYLSTAKLFLNWLDGQFPPSEMEVRRFFLWREEQGISARSRAINFQQLKKLFSANKWEWPFRSEDRPIAETEAFAPAFSPEEVETLILACPLYTPQQRFYLAIATTYGFRREEILRLSRKDITEETIARKTAKHGRPRIHLIPDEIRPFIIGHKLKKRDASTLSKNFHEMMEKAGLGKRPRWGYHCFRRTLQTLLTRNLFKNDIEPSLAAEWMGWSKKTIGASFFGSVMAGLYMHPEVLDQDPFGIDKTVFSVHPFLPIWRRVKIE